ncbi:MAG: septum formation protein Maf [Candidatus Nealsonbacteria bacterium CG08_land_8_20_14_0_20_43_11]|uniref:dTTP/UTP pyrophosphatase n=1 Tax=Candidatus Nealsonbacteria bacterium CG08_land_8_20_14_0_20_43_11 TaxID=1974706 RepID=A0A2M6T1M5_9BACT|nr:MAG: septum formation protein Maf [Candidatus Nealsonbacteria bacterium CG08_land_8_20_14_0_20_43_11]
MKKIILASVSERRKELLALLIGNNFEIVVSSYEEDNTLNLSPKDLVLLHSLEKGRDVAKSLTEGIVISADTLVVFENQVLGKPKTPEKAKEMLNKINGRTVEVLTGMAVIDIENKKELQNFEIAKIKIKKMSEQEIDGYIKTGEPLDKAGAFAIQGKGAVLIEKIDGDFFNVVGLPLFKLSNLLSQLGISIFDF